MLQIITVLVALTCLPVLATVSTTKVYSINTTAHGATFFDAFTFIARDPGSGYANYTLQGLVIEKGMIWNTTNGTNYIGVDNTTVLDSDNDVGRAAIRLESKMVYQSGLFIADFVHVAGGVCGTWPAL
jgi:hypothetical protein